MMERSDTTSIQYSLFNIQFIAYKVVISIILGLLGFAVNFCFSFSFPPYTAAILIGSLFPILITLTWGWKYGLLSALAGGCQSMWWLWGPINGYAAFFVVPPFILWIIWHGICANLRKKQKDQTFTDITERKQALAESEVKFRLLSENSIDCVWTLSARLRFTYISPSLERMMGFKPEQWVGTTLRSHFRKKEFLKVGVLAVKSLKNYNTFTYVTLETKMLNSKNEEVDLEISGKALLNSNGKLIGIQGVTRDITEHKKAEEELSKYRDHLEELVKKRTKELEEKNKELERFNNLFAGREFRIKELKDKVKKLEKK